MTVVLAIAAAPNGTYSSAMLDRRRIPPFVVSDQGEEIGPGAWWQRREMVVALLHATCVI